MNENEYLTLEQLSEITGLQTTTVRIYLCRAEFEKYADRIKIGKRYKRVFILNKNFIDVFYNFLIIKKQKQHADALKNYWNIYQKLGDKPEMNTFTLEEKYNMVNNQYQSLLKRYKEVLLINKKLEVIEQICQKPADNMTVFDLQNRIKEVLSE